MKVSEFCKDRGNVVKAINEDIAGVKGQLAARAQEQKDTTGKES